MQPKISLIGKFPELEIRDMHFCCIKECPIDDITIHVSMDICAPKSKIGDIMAEILKMRNTIQNEDTDDSEWQLTLERPKQRQARLK